MAIDLGDLINTARAVFRCSTCHPGDDIFPDIRKALRRTYFEGGTGALMVYERGVRWSCGHHRALPDLPKVRPNHFHSKAKQPKRRAA
jgi:hypothetical protein